jgi:hypothetical protein
MRATVLLLIAGEYSYPGPGVSVGYIAPFLSCMGKSTFRSVESMCELHFFLLLFI